MSIYGPKQLAESMRTVRKNTIQIAEDIPEENYGYRATPESRSVAETLLHLLAGNEAARQSHGPDRVSSFDGFDFEGFRNTLLQKEKEKRSKSEIVSLLRTDGEQFCQWVEQLPESLLAETVKMPSGSDPAEKTRFEMLLGAKEHEMHHRAQLMVTERLLGIVPHLTRSRQAAAGSTPAKA